MIEIINLGSKAPEVYVQYPGKRPPSEVYGGVWRSIFDDEGVFFRTPGGEALPFGAGIQLDELKAHNHSFNSGSGEGKNYNHNARHAQYISNQDTSTVGGVETRPINRTVRVWEKIQHM